MVILRTIYTSEEAERRDEEETEIMEAFQKVENRIKEHAKTKVGKAQLSAQDAHLIYLLRPHAFCP